MGDESEVKKEWFEMSKSEREFCFKVFKDQHKTGQAPTYGNLSDDWVKPHNDGFIICLDENCFVVTNKLRSTIGILLGVYCA